MSKHTGFLWVVEDETGSEHGGYFVYDRSTDDALIIAETWDIGEPGDYIGNARLIAAAPDLLAICKAIADSPTSNILRSEIYMTLRGAIAKAERG
jgi:hypothetical protein